MSSPLEQQEGKWIEYNYSILHSPLPYHVKKKENKKTVILACDLYPTPVADAIIVLTNFGQVMGPTGNSPCTNIDEYEKFDRIKEIIKIKPQSLSHLIVIILKLKSLVSSLWTISLIHS